MCGAGRALAPPVMRYAFIHKQSKTFFSRVYSLFLPHHNLFLDTLTAAVLTTILGLTSSFFIQALVDSVFVLGRKPTLNRLGLGMLLVTLSRAGFLGLRSCLLAHLSRRIEADTVRSCHRYLLGLPLVFFSRRTGKILSLMNDAIRTRRAIGAITLSVIMDGVVVLRAAATMAWLDWRLTLQSLQLVPLLLCFIWLLNRRTGGRVRVAMERATRLQGEMAETIGTMYTIRAFRADADRTPRSLIDQRRGKRTTFVTSARSIPFTRTIIIDEAHFYTIPAP